MPKGVTYNQSQADQAEAVADAFKNAGGIPVTTTGITTTTTAIATDGTSGDKTILTPSTGKALRISALYFIATTSVAITLKSGSTAISGAMPLTSHAADYSGPMCLAANQSFVINIATAIAINGYVTWWEV